MLFCFSRGQTPAEAELNFLEVAKRTPRYGVDIHHAKVRKIILVSFERVCM